jgi:hypothetical protein
MDEWEQFAQAADRWLLAYAATPRFAFPIPLVLVGQALECYLQAAYIKLTHNAAQATQFGHDLKALLAACKQHDPGFLPEYEIRDAIYDALARPAPRPALAGPAMEHWVAHRDLYDLAQQFPALHAWPAPAAHSDLSYLEGASGAYWIPLFKAVRAYLGYPLPATEDVLEIALRSHEFPAWAGNYLIQLYTE